MVSYRSCRVGLVSCHLADHQTFSLIWRIPAGEVRLIITAYREKYVFQAEANGRRQLLGEARTQLMSTETMLYQNFTGTFFCLFAQGQGSAARFTDFACIPGEATSAPSA